MLVECHPHADPDAWLLQRPRGSSPAATSAGGGTNQFAPDERRNEEQGLGDAYDQLSEEASRMPPGSDGVVFLPAMRGAMAPEWNGAAGVFTGSPRPHARSHLARAMLEARSACDILQAMKAAGLGVRQLTVVGGGAKETALAADQADVTGLTVRVPEAWRTAPLAPPLCWPSAPACTRPWRRRWIHSCRSGLRSTSPTRIRRRTTRRTSATARWRSTSPCSNRTERISPRARARRRRGGSPDGR